LPAGAPSSAQRFISAIKFPTCSEQVASISAARFGRSASETGSGGALGTTLNVPLAAGSGDPAIVDAFTRKLLPAAEVFRPEFVFVSAGFDAHSNDPLAGLEVTELLMTAYMSAEQERTIDFRPDGLDTYIPAVASGTWKP